MIRVVSGGLPPDPVAARRAPGSATGNDALLREYDGDKLWRSIEEELGDTANATPLGCARGRIVANKVHKECRTFLLL